VSRPEEAVAHLAARIAARAAHDLNNFAAVFSGHIYLLRNGAEPPEKACDAMETTLANLERLARSLTAVGTLGIEEPVPVDLGEVLRRSIEAVGAKVELERPPSLPSFRGRPRDLQLALEALLANAREAGQPGPPIRVLARVEGNSTVITVEDSGPGVAASVREKDFDPLFSTKGEKGRGVGVTIARLVAIMHEGSLTIEDRPEAGSRVSLHLPGAG